MTLEELNRLPADEARRALARCCGAPAWAERLCAGRPFADRAALDRATADAFAALGPDDWREAFAAHARIGDLESLRRKFAATAEWAGEEQRGAAAASEDTLAALADGNRAYEERFGYIFIVFATGKSAGELLALLRARLANGPATELRLAAEEQMKITRLRLDRMVDGAR